VTEHDDPGFDDPAFDELRALLADVRVTGPVPDEVAARLDATLSSLQAERAAETTDATVVPLRSRWRRGVGRALVAAAVLAVVGAGGVGIAQLGSSGSGSDGMTSADRAESDAAGGSGSTTTGASPEGSASEQDVPRSVRGSRPVPSLTTADFGTDAARVMVDLAGLVQTADLSGELAGKSATPAPTDATGQLDSSAETPGYTAVQPPPLTATPQQRSAKSLQALASCAGPDAPESVILPATLDGALVALVFRPPADAAQRVEAWSCDGATLLQSATVPIAPAK
jgi:hypothetical protein